MNIHIRDYLLFRVGLETKAKLAEAKELSIKGLCSLCDGRAERREISSIDIFCYFVFIEEMSRFSSARDCLLCWQTRLWAWQLPFCALEVSSVPAVAERLASLVPWWIRLRGLCCLWDWCCPFAVGLRLADFFHHVGEVGRFSFFCVCVGEVDRFVYFV